MNRKTTYEDSNMGDIFKILKDYKWSIFFITILATLLSVLYLYMTPALYSTYAILKVKPNVQTQAGEIINSLPTTIKLKDVAEEMSLLQTFKVNANVLNEVDLSVQYYQTKDYRELELYKDMPIHITNIEILNEEIIGKKIAIIPNSKGFSLKYFPTISEKIQHLLFETKLFTIDNNQTYTYNTPIENKYFKGIINQKISNDTPVYFLLNGNQRNIFEHIIRNRLTIEQVEKDTSLIKISYKDNIKERGRKYVDALLENFVNQSIKTKNKKITKTAKYIDSQLGAIKIELKNSEERLEAYQVSENIIQPSIQAKTYIRELSDIEIKSSENELKRKLISNLIDFVKNNNNLTAIAPSLTNLNDSSTLTMIDTLQELHLEEESYTQEYTDQYPKLIRVRIQIENLKVRIQDNLRNLYSNIQYQTKNLQDRKKKYELDMKSLPSKERQLINIKRNYEVKARMYEYLLKKQAENKIVQLSSFSNYHIIDHAYNQNTPVNKNPSLILLLGSILGLILGSALALLRHGQNKYIKNREDIEYLTTLPLYGSIPYLKQGKNKISVNNELKSPFSEAFRTLRTNLQFIKQQDKGTVMLITSTIAGEGKSTSAANLATILEMARYKTILLNFDLRKPTLHKFFDVNNEKGISSFLAGKDSMEDIISSTEFANLDIIPSGPIPSDPSGLVLSKELPVLLEKLKEMYEYIIIDTAPIGIISDTKIVMQHSDLNLIIIREDYAEKEFISTLEEMIEKHEFKNIGLILNASKATGGEYGYGYSYEYK